MNLLLQDAIVSSVAAAALVTLVWRTVGLLRPSREESACHACPSCDVPQKELADGAGATVVPMSSLRRRGGEPPRSSVSH